MDIELIIHSSDAAALEQLREATIELREEGHRVRGRITFEPSDAELFAREAALRGADVIIAAGGDGTLNEVVNGIFEACPGAAADALPQLGIVPLGTANDLAGWLGLPGAVRSAVHAAVTSGPRTIDIARLNDRYFLNVSTGGFGAEATEDASEKVKRAVGTLAYVVTGVRKFAALQPSHGRFLTGDEVLYDGDFILFAVGNGCRTGGGNYLTPRANLGDGLLDLVIVQDVTHAEFLRLLPQLRSGAHIESEHVIYRQVPQLRVEPSEELSVNADGEPVDASAFEYSVIPAALRLAVPPMPSE